MKFCFAKFAFNLSAHFRLCLQLFRIHIKKGGKVLLWNQVKSRMEACYTELTLALIPPLTHPLKGNIRNTRNTGNRASRGTPYYIVAGHQA